MLSRKVLAIQISECFDAGFLKDVPVAACLQPRAMDDFVVHGKLTTSVVDD